ncbi:galactose oxidase-like [Pyrus ussuriensis x Pyrus communis]|uniref:Galactose oxidase-like n=1 Tax=Pyrus ussuriensis x Pyrus communis TaxID=2448454 RepID=A0A5N5GY55_9ROSA|nr:galactose oxidase-like [Pyrus ussuriensis x Pyrus communis]
MRMQLLRNDRVIMFDRTDFGKSSLSLANGTCVRNDCTAHSAEYDVQTNTVRPLTVQSDVWCSSGSVAPNGNLIQTGGFKDGERRVRVFEPCTGCEWKEYENTLGVSRWYAANHILPDGRQIIIGGRRAFKYEFYPKTESSSNVHSLHFLVQTDDPNEENNRYPFVFLNVDGNLFIFANNRAILFDYAKNSVVKTYPQIPGGDPRSYPSTGSAVLLPLRNFTAPSIEAEATEGIFVEALNTCGRIKINDPNPQLVVETMPQARVMSDMLLLPDGTVVTINGASFGSAGWELGQNPVLERLVYRPDNAVGSRFEKQSPANIPRMYHSTAVLLRDGRVLVGGSNTHKNYELQAFSPDYLDAKNSKLRPRIVDPKSQAKISYGRKLFIRFSLTGNMATNLVSVTMRLLVLAAKTVRKVGTMTYQVQVTTPASGNLAPSGYYLLYVVHQQIPSEGIWVQIL